MINLLYSTIFFHLISNTFSRSYNFEKRRRAKKKKEFLASIFIFIFTIVSFFYKTGDSEELVN